MNNNEYNSQVFSKPVLKKISLSVNQVFMSFTGLLEVCQNEQCLSLDDRPFQEIVSSFKLRLLADKVTCNFSIQSVLSNFRIKGKLPHSFPQRACCCIWQFSGTRLEDQLFQPEKREISSVIGSCWFRFLFALGSIQNGCVMRQHSTCFILVVP